jgi:hypothetical protein
MTDLQLWDYELDLITSDLAHIKNHQQDVQQKERLALISLKVGTFQMQARLAMMLDKLNAASQRIAVVHDARVRSILHWAGIYSQRVHDYYFQVVELFGKQMWLKLVRTRMPGIAANPITDFSDEHLIELSIRHKQLNDTEVLLREHLANLLNERDKLRHRYDDLCAKRANREAASSMQARFGRSPAEAAKHPVLNRLKSSMKSLAQMATPLSSKYTYLSDLHRHVSEHADLLIQRCKTLALEDLYQPQVAKARVKDREYDASLRQISELRDQLSVAESLFNATPETVHPSFKK